MQEVEGAPVVVIPSQSEVSAVSGRGKYSRFLATLGMTSTSWWQAERLTFTGLSCRHGHEIRYFDQCVAAPHARHTGLPGREDTSRRAARFRKLSRRAGNTH